MRWGRWIALAALGSLGCSARATPSHPTGTSALPDGDYACDSVGLRDGRPWCWVPLDEATRARRDRYLSMSIRGALAHVERRRGAGGFAPHDGVSTFDWVLVDGRAVRPIERHADGRTIEVDEILDGGALILFRDAMNRPYPDLGADATRKRVTFDRDGFVSSARYFDEADRKALGGLGVHELRYARRPDGQIRETRAFDAEGRPTRTREGWHLQRDDFGANACVVHRALFGVNGERVVDVDGTSGYRRTCDAAGLAVRTMYLGVDDRPVADASGVAGWDARRDEHGNLVERRWLDLDGRVSTGGRDEAILRSTFDEKGRAIEEAYLTVTGAPAVRSSGYSIVHRTWDARDHVLEEAYRDANGNAVATRGGYATIRYEYDERGRCIGTATFDALGAPAADGTGADEVEIERDEADAPVVRRRLRSGALTDGQLGWAVERIDRGADGRIEARRFFHATGLPATPTGDRSIVVAFRAPHSPTAVVRTREEALARAEEARRLLVAGVPWIVVAGQYDDARLSLEGEYTSRGFRFPALDDALERTPPGAVTPPVETRRGWFVMRRLP